MAKNDLRGVAVDELTPPDAAVELEILAAEIAAADAAYYQDDAPSLSDAAYDALRQRNEAIETLFPKLIRKDSPSAWRVISSSFTQTLSFSKRMLSCKA